MLPSLISAPSASTSARAMAAFSLSEHAMKTVPSSSTSICAPVRSWMLRMVLPPGPMSLPIFSGSILTVMMRGAYLLMSARGVGITASIWPMMSRRPLRAISKMVSISSILRPRALRSSWMPVMPSRVPLTLKSISPKKSSSPMMSITWPTLPSEEVKRPTEMPAQVALIGTPASIRARQPPQTLAIELEPLDSVISLIRRTV